MCPGADLGFSRGGGDFEKFSKFCRSFFRSTELIFRALPKHGLVRVLAKFSAPQAGADLGFSRGGRIFKKKFENFDDLFFFRSTKLIFRDLPKHCFAPILAKFSASQAVF